jgi:hypothetical protein
MTDAYSGPRYEFFFSTCRSQTEGRPTWTRSHTLGIRNIRVGITGLLPYKPTSAMTGNFSLKRPSVCAETRGPKTDDWHPPSLLNGTVHLCSQSFVC